MKKTVIVLVVLALLAAMTAAVALASGDQATSGSVTKPSLEQRQQIREKLSALTEDQKNELNGIQSQINELRKKMIDKYAEFGVITQEQADQAKTRMDERQNKMQENGMLPGPFGGRGGMRRGGCKNRFGACPEANAPADSGTQAPAAAQTSL